MAQFDQFANQGGAAAWDPTKTAEAKRIAEEQLQNADYSGTVPEPLGQNAAPHELDDDTRDGDNDGANEFSDAGLDDAGLDAKDDGGHDKNGGGAESAAPRY